MNHFDGTSARQLDLLDDMEVQVIRPQPSNRVRPAMRVLRKDIYAELARRRPALPSRASTDPVDQHVAGPAGLAQDFPFDNVIGHDV